MKKYIALILACLLLSTAVFAAPAAEQNAADALNHLGLFLGTGKGYELDATLTRVQGVTLLVRLLGAEEEAQKGSYSIPFTDVADWAKPYVGYAYKNGITNGISADKFGSNDSMKDYMFLTLCLRALGYKDSGDKPNFTWNEPYPIAQKVGLIDTATATAEFLRGNAALVMWNALSAPRSGGSGTLSKELMQKGVFYQGYLDVANRIFEEGAAQGGGSVNPTPEPSNPGSGSSGSSGSGSSSSGLTYEEYLAMDADAKQAHRDSFASVTDFFTWFHAAREEYEASQNNSQIGPDGVIDLGKEFGNN